MKKLFIIILIIYAVTNPITVHADAETKARMGALSRRVHAKDVAKAELDRLNKRANAEAKRLNAGPDKIPVIRSIIRVFGNDSRTALAVAKAESGLRCTARNENTNGTADHSVFQINDVHKKRGNLDDCEENIKIAYKIFKEQGGFQAWVAYLRGRHLVFM